MRLIPAIPVARLAWRSAAAPLMLAALVFHAPVAAATTVVHFGTAQLADRSDTIVRGVVTAVESRMHPEHQFIYTYVSVLVDEVYRGNPTLVGSTITLQELGGQVGPRVHEVAGVPRFEADEQVLVFLDNHPSGYFRTYGMVQGKFRFETDARTGELLLTRPADLNEAVMAYPGNATDLTPARPDGNYEAAPLLQSLRELRDLR